MPSIRRSQESLITIPLPLVQVNSKLIDSQRQTKETPELISLPGNIALLMCDPEWKVKTGVEIFVFIHRPGEKFSQLLSRWRQTQILLSQGYRWQMPLGHKHIFGERADKIYPLFILSDGILERIQKGLQGAYLPVVMEMVEVSILGQESAESAKI